MPNDKEYSRRYYQTHPKYNVPWGRENRIKIRSEMINAYGGKCVACGIDNPIVLDIDHIDNSGGVHRKNGMWGWRLYRWLRKNGYPKDNYQLLCKNCNWIKEMERRKEKVAYQIIKAIALISTPEAECLNSDTEAQQGNSTYGMIPQDSDSTRGSARNDTPILPLLLP